METPLSESTYTIVIAKYKEDISWIQEMQKDAIVIYDKSGETNSNPPPVRQYLYRDNIGREGETFLYHIIANYENLTDYVIFLQGHPFDHCEFATPQELQTGINELISAQPTEVHGFGAFHAEHEKIIMCFQEYCDLLFDGQNYDTIKGFYAGCQYLVPKPQILARPKQFYERLYAMSRNHPHLNDVYLAHWNEKFDPEFITGWCLERFWGFILGLKNLPMNPRFIDAQQ